MFRPSLVFHNNLSLTLRRLEEHRSVCRPGATPWNSPLNGNFPRASSRVLRGEKDPLLYLGSSDPCMDCPKVCRGGSAPMPRSRTIHASAESTDRWFVSVFGSQIGANILFGDSAGTRVFRSTKKRTPGWAVPKNTPTSPPPTSSSRQWRHSRLMTSITSMTS
jgi:hypothetical protein